MLRDHDMIPRRPESQRRLEPIRIGEPAFDEMIEGGRPHTMDPPTLFSHREHALRGVGSRREMQVADLGQRVANRVIHRSFADLASLHVSDRDPQGERRRGRRQHLVPIGDEQQ